MLEGRGEGVTDCELGGAEKLMVVGSTIMVVGIQVSELGTLVGLALALGVDVGGRVVTGDGVELGVWEIEAVPLLDGGSEVSTDEVGVALAVGVEVMLVTGGTDEGGNDETGGVEVVLLTGSELEDTGGVPLGIGVLVTGVLVTGADETETLPEEGVGVALEVELTGGSTEELLGGNKVGRIPLKMLDEELGGTDVGLEGVAGVLEGTAEVTGELTGELTGVEEGLVSDEVVLEGVGLAEGVAGSLGVGDDEGN